MKYTGMNHTCKDRTDMSRMSTNPPALEAWRRSNLKAGAQQYVALVRAFLNKRKTEGIQDITEDEIVSYCLAAASKGMREKIVRALTQFFAFQFRSGAIPKNQALDLKDRIKEITENETLLRDLMDAGMTKTSARALRWRDVAAVVFRTTLRSKRTPPKNSPIMLELSRRFLLKMKYMKLQDVDYFLDRRLC